MQRPLVPMQRLQLFRFLCIMLDRNYRKEYLGAQKGFGISKEEGNRRLKELCQRFRVPVAYDPTIPYDRTDIFNFEDLSPSRHGAVIPYLGVGRFQVKWYGKRRSGEREVSGKLLLEVDLESPDEEILEKVKGSLRLARSTRASKDSSPERPRSRLHHYLRIWELHNNGHGLKAIKEALASEGVETVGREIKRAINRINILIYRELPHKDDGTILDFPCHRCDKLKAKACPGTCDELEAYFASDPLTRDVTFPLERTKDNSSVTADVFDLHDYVANIIDSLDPEETHSYNTEAQDVISKLKEIDRQNLSDLECQCLDSYLEAQSYTEVGRRLLISRAKAKQIIRRILVQDH